MSRDNNRTGGEPPDDCHLVAIKKGFSFFFFILSLKGNVLGFRGARVLRDGFFFGFLRER